MTLRSSLLCLTLSAFFTNAFAQGEWTPITGEQALRDYMSGVRAERELPNGSISTAEYFADGTGVLRSWGETFPRTWRIQGENQICVEDNRSEQCFTLERSNADPDLYRATVIGTGEQVEFRSTGDVAVAQAEPKDIGGGTRVATPSADELAAELSNPNSALASLTFKNQYRWYEGSLPGADDQSNYTLLFQPGLPFVLGGGDKIIFRPGIPFISDQPIFDGVSGEFGSKSGLGDIAFDLVYAPRSKGNELLAYGIISSLPTASEGLGTDRYTLGPELLLGANYSRGLFGALTNHQWDIGGSGDADINLTSIQVLWVHLPGGGYNIGSSPLINYDWESEQWTVPINVSGGKTVVWNGRPWKLSAEINYYAEKPDAFGPEWMIGFNIAPVVKNGLTKWFGLDN